MITMLYQKIAGRRHVLSLFLSDFARVTVLLPDKGWRSLIQKHFETDMLVVCFHWKRRSLRRYLDDF